MATQAQLEQDLINAVATVRVKNDRAPMDFKFSNGKTYTVYSDGSGNAEDAGINFRNLTDKFNAAEAALRPAAKSTTPVSQVAPQASTPAPNNPPPVQQTTPVAQVAPQTSTPFALQGGNAAFFPNLDPKTGLPIIKQSVIDAELNRTKQNVLTANNSNIRDAIYGSGWNAKSDAVSVLHGAAVYGLNKARTGMGSLQYQSPDGKALTDADFVNAAKAAGIDPSQYYSQQIVGMGNKQNVLNKDALYNAINDKAKNLYSITNTIESGARGTKTPHATILFTSDGQGNLVAAANPQTGQPAIKYASATRYAEAPGFLEEWGPLLGMAGLAFGVPAIMNAVGSAGVSAGTWAAANEAAGLGTMAAGTLAPDVAALIGSGVGAAGGGFAGGGFGSIGPEAFTAYTGAPATAGLTAEQIAASGGGGFGNGGYGSIGNAANAAGQLTPEQLAAAQQALNNASQITGISASQIPGMNAAAQAAGIGGGLGTSISALSSLSKLLGLDSGGATSTGGVAGALTNSALSNILGSGGQALASYFGGQAQADAAKEAAKNQMTMFNTINSQLAPQRGAGYQALNQIRSMLPGQSMAYNELGQPAGVQTGTDYLTRQFTPQDLQAGLAPNYQFMLNQGQQQTQRQANLAGGAMGGNALRALQDYTQNYAGNAYQNAFGNFQNQRTGIYNTLAGIAGLGQQAVNTGAQAGQAATTAAGQLGVGSAAAQAAGLSGAANAAQGGVQNYQQNQILQAILGQNQNVAQTPPYAP